MNKLPLTRRAFTGGALAAIAASAHGAAHAGYTRLCYVCDGHRNDRDDIGSAAMALALLGDAGYQRPLVHVTYACPPGGPVRGWLGDIAGSVDGAYSRWNHTADVFDASGVNVVQAVDDLIDHINVSGPGNMLAILAAGPMELIWRALSSSEPALHAYTTIVSHSAAYNENTGAFNLARIRRDFAVGVHRIPNQNTRLNTQQSWSPWYWLRDSRDERLKFVWERMRVAGRADVSDAGMAYFAIYGKETPTISDLRNALA